MKHNKVWRGFFAALVVMSIVLPAGTVMAQDKPANCIQPGAPAKMEGEVVKIDPTNGTVTVRESSGATHDFRASAETLKDYKVGDRIAATLRPGQECKKS